MAVSTETTKEKEEGEVIVRGQGWYMKLRALGSCATIIARLTIPAILATYNVWLRSQRLILHKISTQINYAITSLSITLRFQTIGVYLVEAKSRLKPLIWTETSRMALDPTEDVKDIFCEVLHDPGPDQTKADVIFIHGLKGSLYKTWKQGLWDTNNKSDIRWIKLNSSNDNEEQFESNEDQSMGQNEPYFEPDDDPSIPGEYSKCWPKDWLPMDCPGVRIIAVNYSTDPFLWKPFWIPAQQRLPMNERAREMMSLLLELGVGSRPIVWVGHSKGGLFVKQMLVHACESENPADIAICCQSKAILFYSVPHRGSPLASIDLPLLTRSIELREVMADSLEVQYLQEKFQYLINSNLLQVKIKSFIETKLTLMTILYLRIVSVQSADLGIGELYGVPLDHRDICKPKNRYCFLYRELVSLIHSVVTLPNQQRSSTRHQRAIVATVSATLKHEILEENNNEYNDSPLYEIRSHSPSEEIVESNLQIEEFDLHDSRQQTALNNSGTDIQRHTNDEIPLHHINEDIDLHHINEDIFRRLADSLLHQCFHS
uniref:Protein SERAC1 n=1 Tax=Cacopsylla melanoneura TaxID=428564 RepID=A0A8D8XXA7_9HEMI